MATADYDVISADSHVVEAHDLWQQRVPAKLRDRAPRLVHEETTDRLLCDDAVLPPVGLLAGCARGDDEVRVEGRWDEDVFRGGYDPDIRMEDLARDAVDAEVLFPTIGMQMYPIKDPDFQWALFKAYNSWLAEEFCAAHPDRLFGVAMLNHEDVDAAIAELVRAREMGLVGVMVPLYAGEENPYWDERFDPLWAAAVEHQMPVNLHAATNRVRKYDFSARKTESPSQAMANSAQNVRGILMDMIFFGLFDRFPELKVVSVENDAGWAGHLLESSDYSWHRGKRLREQGANQHAPSYYFHEGDNIKLTFMRDRTAILAHEVIGLNALLWGNDFPHHVSTWPHSKELLDEHFHDQPVAVRDRVVRENVRDLYHLP
jgi:predicted TIM-barrel fold metal-dependent hydrolase